MFRVKNSFVLLSLMVASVTASVASADQNIPFECGLMLFLDNTSGAVTSGYRPAFDLEDLNALLSRNPQLNNVFDQDPVTGKTVKIDPIVAAEDLARDILGHNIELHRDIAFNLADKLDEYVDHFYAINSNAERSTLVNAASILRSGPNSWGPTDMPGLRLMRDQQDAGFQQAVQVLDNMVAPFGTMGYSSPQSDGFVQGVWDAMDVLKFIVGVDVTKSKREDGEFWFYHVTTMNQIMGGIADRIMQSEEILEDRRGAKFMIDIATALRGPELDMNNMNPNYWMEEAKNQMYRLQTQIPEDIARFKSAFIN